MDAASRVERVFRDDSARLWRALFLSFGNREIASDAVAEAFAQALRRGAEIRDVAAWVWRVAFRMASREAAAARRMTMLPDLVPYEMPESLVDLVDALARLTPHQRTAIVLAEYGGYSHREIAQLIGSSTAAVAVHAHRARKRLRALLEDEGDD